MILVEAIGRLSVALGKWPWGFISFTDLCAGLPGSHHSRHRVRRDIIEKVSHTVAMERAMLAGTLIPSAVRSAEAENRDVICVNRVTRLLNDCLANPISPEDPNLQLRECNLLRNEENIHRAQIELVVIW